MTDPRNLAAYERREEAYERLAMFTRALMRARGDTHDAVAKRSDAAGEPYISSRTLSTAVSPKPNDNAGKFSARTWRRLNLALQLEPGTLQGVFATGDHGLDPGTLPRWELPGMPSPAGLSATERKVAQRIADRAANGAR